MPAKPAIDAYLPHGWLAVCVAAATLAAPGAGAAEWRFQPRVEAREAFTDNARLSRTSREADFVTRIAPGFSLGATGGRIVLDLDYALGYDAYARESDLDGVRHDLRGTGRVELLEQNLFVDLGAFAGESPVLARGRVSAIDRSLGGNSSQLYTYSVSPYWKSHLGAWADAELRYRFSQVAVRRARGDLDTAPAPTLMSDSDIHQASAAVVGGENFDRLRWRIAADHAETTVGDAGAPTLRGSSTSLRRQSASVQPGYVVTRWLTLFGTAGYDRIESGSFRRDLDGGFWNGGIRMTPSPRTRFELAYGERYGGPNWSSSLTAATESGTALTFAYRETVENQALQAADGLSFLGRDAAGQLIDNRTGLPFVGRDPFFDQGDRTFLSRVFTLSLRVPQGRDTFVASAQHAVRETQFGGVLATPGREETTTAAALGWERRLTEAIAANATLSYADTRTDPNGVGAIARDGTSTTTALRLGLDYDLAPTLRGGIGFAHLRREVSGPQFSPSEFTGAYSENVVFLTLRKTF
jgi:uncharacterized protein (PEP-CTERM system associated)